MRYCLSICLLLLSLSSTLTADEILYPADFGLKLTQHGQIDLHHLPASILVGNFNGDCYPDLAKFEANRIEVYISLGYGFPEKPSGMRYFDKPIKSFRLTGERWLNQHNIAVTLIDGSEETIPNYGGCLQIEREDNVFKEYGSPPPRVSEADFQLVWESEPRPYGMNHCAVGDVDNDGIVELCTWYKTSQYWGDAYILIYKSIGDDEYELYMEEQFYCEPGQDPALSQMLITDIDDNGQKELMYTYQFAYFWEFYTPGVYIIRRGFSVPWAVYDMKETDVDQDGIKEISFICDNWDFQPPTYYGIEEYSWKTATNFGFQGITGFYQDWITCRMDIGDFDNDGAMDIVPSSPGLIINPDTLNLVFYRYDTTQLTNFSYHIIYTGYPFAGLTPLIKDFDNDNLNELFAAGLYVNGSVTFLYKGTGLGIGSTIWYDTTYQGAGPYDLNFGYVDYYPSVIITSLTDILPEKSQLCLWSYIDTCFVKYWQSDTIQYSAYRDPYIIDTDFDSKQNIILANNEIFSISDWEQVNPGVYLSNDNSSNSEQMHIIPNPFNECTSIHFYIEESCKTKLKIYNLTGKEIYNNEFFVKKGEQKINWNAGYLSSGIYLFCMEINNKTYISKGLLIK